MDLYYEINGIGQPVVLIHSGGADLRQWTYLAPLLAQKYTVVAFDGRGAGKSPAPGEYTSYVEDLRSLLDHLKLRKATIVGHNIGGQIATDFALVYPERVSKLVLITPSLTGYRYSPEAEKNVKRVVDAAPDLDKMTEVFLETQAYQTVADSPLRDFAIQLLRHHFRRMLEWPPFTTVWPQPPAIGRLHELNPKTLFIIGEKDLTDHHQIADHFRTAPNIQFAEISEADHIMMALTNPEELNEKITAFLEE